jgi:hypothetical protein
MNSIIHVYRNYKGRKEVGRLYYFYRYDFAYLPMFFKYTRANLVRLGPKKGASVLRGLTLPKS